MDISWCWKSVSRSLQGRDLGATRNQGYQDLSPTRPQALPSHLETNVSSWWDVSSVRRRRGGETKAHLLGVSLCPKVRVECGRHLPLATALGSRICLQTACCLLHPSWTPSLPPLGLWSLRRAASLCQALGEGVSLNVLRANLMTSSLQLPEWRSHGWSTPASRCQPTPRTHLERRF